MGDGSMRNTPMHTEIVECRMLYDEEKQDGGQRLGSGRKVWGQEEERETQKDKKGQRTERTRQRTQTQTRHRKQEWSSC